MQHNPALNYVQSVLKTQLQSLTPAVLQGYLNEKQSSAQGAYVAIKHMLACNDDDILAKLAYLHNNVKQIDRINVLQAKQSLVKLFIMASLNNQIHPLVKLARDIIIFIELVDQYQQDPQNMPSYQDNKQSLSPIKEQKTKKIVSSPNAFNGSRVKSPTNMLKSSKISSQSNYKSPTNAKQQSQLIKVQLTNSGEQDQDTLQTQLLETQRSIQDMKDERTQLRAKAEQQIKLIQQQLILLDQREAQLRDEEWAKKNEDLKQARRRIDLHLKKDSYHFSRQVKKQEEDVKQQVYNM